VCGVQCRRALIKEFPELAPSPLLIKMDGQDQLAAVMSDEVVGLNPDSGDLLSKRSHSTMSRASLLHSNAWTAPALVDTTLYVRDRQSMMALDLR
jgi:hypothetical protein